MTFLSENEEWKSIPGYEGIYEASSLGRIRTAEGKTTSSARFKRRVWKQRIMKTKYSWRKGKKLKDERISLWKDGKPHDYLVSRLIAMTFVPISYDELTVNHINGNPLDNRAENLEWVTHRKNIQLGFETGLYDSCKRPVVLIDSNGNSISFETMTDASNYLGRNKGYVSQKISVCRPCFSKSGEKYFAELVTEQ